MLTLVYNCLVNMAPFYLTSLFHVCTSKYNLRGLKSSFCLRWQLLLLDLTLFSTYLFPPGTLCQMKQEALLILILSNDV